MTAVKTLSGPAPIPDGFPDPFARRMNLLPPYLLGRINAHNDRLRAEGVDVIDLGMGNPVDPVPDVVIRAMEEALPETANHRYSQARGILPLKEAFARHYQRNFNVALDPRKEIIATIGSKEAFSHLCLALLGPGEACVVPTPAFTIHLHAPMIAGASAIGVFMREEEPGAGLLADLKRTFETLRPRPKFLVLNFPHNPTAKTVERSFFEEAVSMARHFKFWVLNDFAYGHSCFDGYQAPSILQVPGAKDVAVETFTMSKPYNMAGWRVGFLAGNAHLVESLGRIKGYFDYGIFQCIQLGAAAALDEGDAFIQRQAGIYQQRRDVLLPGLAEAGWGRTIKNRATMFTWQPLPEGGARRGMNSLDFCRKLVQQTGVSLAPGGGFGDEGEGFVRIALVESEARLREACRRIGSFLKGG